MASAAPLPAILRPGRKRPKRAQHPPRPFAFAPSIRGRRPCLSSRGRQSRGVAVHRSSFAVRHSPFAFATRFGHTRSLPSLLTVRLILNTYMDAFVCGHVTSSHPVENLHSGSNLRPFVPRCQPDEPVGFGTRLPSDPAPLVELCIFRFLTALIRRVVDDSRDRKNSEILHTRFNLFNL